MNLELQFNTNIIKKVKSLHFHVDQIGSILFVLFALYENREDMLDEFDDSNKERRAIFLYKEMEIRGLIAETDKEDEVLYVLTKQGEDLVEYIKSEFMGESRSTVTTEDIAVKGVESLTDAVREEPEYWIEEWREFFPRGVRSGGKLVRSDSPSCLRKMKVFMNDYPMYNKEVIMSATRNYINAKAEENYAYIRCAIYFIYRQDGGKQNYVSDLATWCQDFVEGKDLGTPENNMEIMA